MKFRYLLTLSLSSLVMVGCVREVSNNQPDKIPVAVKASIAMLTTQTKSLAQTAPSENATTIKSGTFVSGEHTTQGTVRIITKNGKSVIQLEPSFKTSSSGPDLVVILHRSSNVINSTKPPAYPLKKADYIILAPLRKFSGAQTYLIPNNINLANYKSVAIWCRQFNATFGAANFSQ